MRYVKLLIYPIFNTKLWISVMEILRGPSLHNLLIAHLCVGIKDDMNDVNNQQWGIKCSSTFVHKQLSCATGLKQIGPKLAQVNWLRAYNEQLIHIRWQLAGYKSHCMQDGGTRSNPRSKYFVTLTQVHVRFVNFLKMDEVLMIHWLVVWCLQPVWKIGPFGMLQTDC